MPSVLSRRDCIRYGVGTSSVLALGTTVPGFLPQSCAAAKDDGETHRILVVVELDGGNDGLNTVVPYADDEYYRRRPKLSIPRKNVLTVDQRVGLHPSLSPLRDMLESEQLAIVQSVGYPNPTRSHFRSRNIWYSGQLDASASTQGWLSRYIDASELTAVNSPAIMVGESVSQSLAGGMYHAPAVDRLDRLNRRLGVPREAQPEEQLRNLDRVMADRQSKDNSLLQYIQKSQLVSFASSKRLSELLRVSKLSATGRYPGNPLGQRLRVIAQLIQAQLRTRVFYVRFEGFDTHSNQAVDHQLLLSQLSSALAAFVDDLTAAGEMDRVLLLAFSEFGRRLTENHQGGTDHGSAGPVFLVGPAVHGGLHGPPPNLEDLDESGDPKFAIDFRSVYASVLDRWLGCKPIDVLAADLEQHPVL